MSENTIDQIVELASKNLLEPPTDAIAASVDSASSSAPPYEWDKGAFQDALEVKIPYGLEALWKATSELRLYEDMTYGQWGIVIWGPDAAIGKQSIKEERRSDFLRGDLIIGEFLGDSELVMLRCDESAPDFGNTVIVLPIDARPSWPTVGVSLVEFLSRLVKENGRKFWLS